MIKIIVNGKKAPSKRAQCHECGCIFEYHKSDMHILCTEGSFESYFIECPQCGKVLKLSEWDNEEKADSAPSSDLRAISKWCDEQAWNCMGCPLNDACNNMFSSMSPNIWKEKDIEAFEKEIRK